MTYYDEISEGYDELHKEEQLKKINIIKSNIEINKDWKILDVGCGSYYGDWNIPKKVTGIDPALKLLEKAKSKKINVLNICAEDLDKHFNENEFDLIVSITAIQNFDNIRKGLENIKLIGKRFALTYLKRSPNSKNIESLIKELFVIDKIIEEDKDWIYICRK